ncbi:transcriptional regulator, XRE family with cupin sensor [Dethiosulfatibacter aminovorans DSM 17477]|uniref:Transcriptional regulator, XRE family with cupin sensor n=1 Tax=Dethiosulfatibacter aminovorans DSM 17477 TaxID=1121476 RepID=A0A1M6N4D8_9FIRM|nr:XRE family transcriptional regulator [Dethiosulfatibacter aminovorans]SHJ90581.1 transcriptional regulator, XRE family with cupin sensor [Dethiosulfatibacter aminovorans DSM 17477]
MDKINVIVGENLKKIRKERNLTLKEMSDITGVSKSMLGEIERSVSNPTIAVLWKIASGLKIPFTQLIHSEKASVNIVRSPDMKIINSGDEFTISSIFDYDPEKKFEIYTISFPVKSKSEIKQHNKGIEEYILIFEGELVVEIGGVKHQLNTGDSITFLGDIPHRYLNESNMETKVYSIMYYTDNNK